MQNFVKILFVLILSVQAFGFCQNLTKEDLVREVADFDRYEVQDAVARGNFNLSMDRSKELSYLSGEAIKALQSSFSVKCLSPKEMTELGYPSTTYGTVKGDIDKKTKKIALTILLRNDVSYDEGINAFYHEAIHVFQQIILANHKAENEQNKKETMFYYSISKAFDNGRKGKDAKRYLMDKYGQDGELYYKALYSSSFCSEYSAYYLAANFAQFKDLSRESLRSFEKVMLNEGDRKPLIDHILYSLSLRYDMSDFSEFEIENLVNTCEMVGFGPAVQVFNMALTTNSINQVSGLFEQSNDSSKHLESASRKIESSSFQRERQVHVSTR